VNCQWALRLPPTVTSGSHPGSGCGSNSARREVSSKSRSAEHNPTQKATSTSEESRCPPHWHWQEPRLGVATSGRPAAPSTSASQLAVSLIEHTPALFLGEVGMLLSCRWYLPQRPRQHLGRWGRYHRHPRSPSRRMPHLQVQAGPSASLTVPSFMMTTGAAATRMGIGGPGRRLLARRKCDAPKQRDQNGPRLRVCAISAFQIADTSPCRACSDRNSRCHRLSRATLALAMPPLVSQRQAKAAIRTPSALGAASSRACTRRTGSGVRTDVPACRARLRAMHARTVARLGKMAAQGRTCCECSQV
jgi:hypothetical protein